jgi:hypothetical protein
MHFYDGGSEAWLRNLTNGPGISGTQNWTIEQQQFTAPATASLMGVLLRSAGNSGTAWFDDVSLRDGGGRILQQFNFDDGADQFGPERGPREPCTTMGASGTTTPAVWLSPEPPTTTAGAARKYRSNLASLMCYPSG